MREQQQAIITELGTRPTIDPEKEIAQRSQFLGDYLAATGLRGFVLGISGGQDSLLAGLLAKRAAHAHGATFHALLLPYGNQADRNDAEMACAVIQPDVTYDMNIKATVDAFTDTFNIATGTPDRPLSDFDKGNVKARSRMIAQYALAGHEKLLVVGTDHAAEAVTGFFTKFGDGGADIFRSLASQNAKVKHYYGHSMHQSTSLPKRRPPTCSTPHQAKPTRLNLA